MNRSKVIEKIKAMLALQESTDFDGEASAAANLIQKLCEEHGISLDSINIPEILDETFEEFSRYSQVKGQLLHAVANFYDAVAYIKNGTNKSLKVIGSEAQIVQTKLYYEYLYEVMEKEAEKAFLGEKVLADLTGGTSPSKSFKNNFRLSFVQSVQERLKEMKDSDHPHKKYTQEKLQEFNFKKTKKASSAYGEGAYAGISAGSSVSLNKQTSGSHQKFLTSAASL